MFCILWWDLLLFYQKVCWEFPSFEEGNFESWPSLCNEVCSLQYISKYPCSYPSSNIVFLLSSTCGCSLDVLTCQGFPPELYISKDLGMTRARNFVQNLLHVYIIILWCEWRDLFHVVVLCHLINALMCVCRMDQFSASEEELLTCPLWGL